jgi:hypothetical protein
MTSTTLPPSTSPSAARRGVGRPDAAASSVRRGRRRGARRPLEARVLDRYVDRRGDLHELVTRAGAAGSTLVIDRGAGGEEDQRLVAHLSADEPAANAQLVCSAYLQDVSSKDTRCRRVSAEDRAAPPLPAWAPALALSAERLAAELIDGERRSYSLERVSSGLRIPELRWCRRRAEPGAPREPVSVREAIARLESYEPVCQLTQQALESAPGAPEISSSVLRAELVRVQSSPIVLNRGLREAVLRAVAREQLSMSEIALRCGRIKRDRKGNQAGETSWLARRLGLRPESGHGAPTPWIHSDVLGLIAREGLGMSPREVEV